MPLLSNHETARRRQELVIDQDGKCALCSKPDVLILDHKDNNRQNNAPENHQALCISCNTAKNHPKNLHSAESKGKKKNERVSGRRRERESASPDDDESRYSPELSRAQTYRPMFRKFVQDTVRKEIDPRMDRLLNGFHEISGISQQALRRWLDGMCSPEGGYLYFKDETGKIRVRTK